MDRVTCDNCGWELRESDLHCSFCGRSQRAVVVEPKALGLTSPEAGEASVIQALSPGRVQLRNTGRQSFRVLSIGAPGGVEVSATPPLAKDDGLVLPVGAALELQGSRAGKLTPGSLRIQLRTSIGTIGLPVLSQPPPPIGLSRRHFQVPRGKLAEVRSELSIDQGFEWLRLEVQGAGLTLVEPADRVRLEARAPLDVVLQVDVLRSVADGDRCGLIVALDDGLRLLVPLTFEEAAPGRLLLASGVPFLDIRVFPGERISRDLELLNDGVLDFTVHALAVTTDAGEPFPGLRPPRLVDAMGRTLELPCTVPAGATATLRLESEVIPAGDRMAGALLARGDGNEVFQLPLRVDPREPPRHPFPVGLDFGTSVSAIATRSASQARPGRVESITFEPGAANYLPSDVEIVDAPDKPAPDFLVDWGGSSTERHVAYARNLKRRLGLAEVGHETVAFRGQVLDVPVEDIAAFVVGEMKRQAEIWLGARIHRAVATVPTRFSLRRVNAIREVFARAGLPGMRVIDEAVAAGILGMYKEFRDREPYTMLVYDMGGGTTDVTLFRVENRRVDGVLEIRPTVHGVAGDAGLGGRDVTEWMVRHFLASLPPAERETIPWPGDGLAAPELRQLARFNQSFLFKQLEMAKLNLFPLEGPVPQPQVVTPYGLLNRAGKPALLSPVEFTGAEVEAEFLPRLEKLWREVLDTVRAAGIGTLDVLFFAGRSILLPFVRRDLLRWLAAEGPFPKLEAHYPHTLDGKFALKEAVSLGACLSLDLVDGIDEVLVLENLSDRSASRFGVRNQRGDFLEILPANWRLGQPSEQRVRIRLGTRLRSDLYEAHVEIWENPTRDHRVDGNPEAELIGTASPSYAAAEVDPTRPTIEVGLLLREDRRMTLLTWYGGEVKEWPVEP